MRDLSGDKIRLRKAIGERGITYVLKYLKDILPTEVPKYEVLVQIEAAYSEVKMKMLEGLLDHQEIQQANAQIRRRLMDFINSLELADFDRDAKGTNFDKNRSIKRGHVLYQVPQTMQLWEETRCLVRIAFDKATLIEDIDIDEHTQFRSNVRISDYMKVEIIDPASTPVFEVRTTSEPIQLIDQDDFTEWRFYVKPLQPGKHVLELKVNIIVRVNDKEIIREKTLEESVVIVAEEVPAEETAFKQLDESFITEGGPIDKLPGGSGGSGYRLPKNVRMLALLLLGVFGFGTASYAFVPSFAQEVDWAVVNNLQKSEKSYERFIEKYEEKRPQSKRIETAYFKKAVVQESPEALREYIEQRPDSRYQEDASWELAELTQDPIDYLEYASRYDNTLRTKIAQQKVIEKEEVILQEVTTSKDTSAVRLLEKYLQVAPERKNSERLQPVIRQVQPIMKEKGIKSEVIPTPETTEVTPEEVTEEEITQKEETKPEVGTTEEATSTESSQEETTEATAEDQSEAATEDTNLPVEESSEPIAQEVEDEQAEDVTTDAEETPSTQEKATAELPEMIFVQGGPFKMGDEYGESDEYPHQVMLSPYYIGRTEVTFEEYDLFCAATGRDLPYDEGWGRGQRPVINVSWNDAVAYCNWLSEQEGLQAAYTIRGENVSANWQANGYRLPTEAEWEYAARSQGQPEKWAGTSQESDLSKYANYDYNIVKTQLVGSYAPNDLGLYDMSGNVWEWCWDWYGDNYYEQSVDATNPTGPGRGRGRVHRGGGWYNSARNCSTADRYSGSPGSRNRNLGFRLARSSR